MAIEMHERRNSSAARALRWADTEIAALAERQHGVVARRQLLELGVDRHAIRYRLLVGRLYVLHPGIYAVGHRAVSVAARDMAAVLACGPGALLSHRAAGSRWRLRPSARPGIDVTVPRRRGEREGIELHVGLVPPDERTMRDGIPVTTVPRTLLDLAAVLRPDQLERAIEQAELLRLTDPLSLPVVLQRYPGRRGTATLRRLLAGAQLGATVTRSTLEERFLAFVADIGLPRPEVNAWLRLDGEWIEVDCLWRAERVALELDGHRVHGTRAAFERDRSRDRLLHVEGWTPVRITWRQLARDASGLESDLRALLTT